MSTEDVGAMLDRETYMDAQECLNNNFCDKVQATNSINVKRVSQAASITDKWKEAVTIVNSLLPKDFNKQIKTETMADTKISASITNKLGLHEAASDVMVVEAVEAIQNKLTASEVNLTVAENKAKKTAEELAAMREKCDNLQKEIITKVENGVLIVSCKVGNFMNVASKKVIVKMPVIEGLEASSASTINSTNTLKGNSLNLVSSSAGSIHTTAEYENIQLTSSSASNQTIKGKAIQLETSSSSGSVLNAGKLLANKVVAHASSGSSITVFPILNLNAEASSGGNITYIKNPKSIQKEENSGGSVHQE